MFSGMVKQVLNKSAIRAVKDYMAWTTKKLNRCSRSKNYNCRHFKCNQQGV